MKTTIERDEVANRIHQIVGNRFGSYPITWFYADALAQQIVNTDYSDLYQKLTVVWNWASTEANRFIDWLFGKSFVFYTDFFDLCAWCKSYNDPQTNHPFLTLTDESYEIVSRDFSHGCCAVCADKMRSEFSVQVIEKEDN